MKRFCLFLASSLLIGTLAAPAGAQYYRENEGPTNLDEHTVITVSNGIRLDELDWNIASDLSGTATPNILSELEWTDVMLYEIKAKLEHTFPMEIPLIKGRLHIDAEAAYGGGLSGDNTDSDWNGDDRTEQFSESESDAGGSSTYGVRAALGYQINLNLPKNKMERYKYGGRYIYYRKPNPKTYFTITPMAGYSWEAQDFRMEDGVQTLSDFGFTVPVGTALTGLNSEYNTEWSGPFIAAKLDIEDQKHKGRLQGEFHLLDYEADAIWNLRTDFAQNPSFIHEGDGDGIKLNAEYAYSFSQSTAFTVEATYVDRSIEDGLDTVFFSNGTQTSTKLNEVNSSTQSLHIGLRYKW
jgi:hypothetical protein